MDQKNYPPASLAWLVWGLGAAFYFSGFYHRVAPAVMTDQLMADFPPQVIPHTSGWGQATASQVSEITALL